MKFKKQVKLQELWFFRLAAILGWIISNVVIFGTVGEVYILNLWDGFFLFSMVIAAKYSSI